MRRLAIAAAGFGLLAAGAALLVLPGPGLVVLAAGLALLAREFSWARRALDRVTAHAKRARKARTRTKLALAAGGAAVGTASVWVLDVPLLTIW